MLNKYEEINLGDLDKYTKEYTVLNADNMIAAKFVREPSDNDKVVLEKNIYDETISRGTYYGEWRKLSDEEIAELNKDRKVIKTEGSFNNKISEKEKILAEIKRTEALLEKLKTERLNLLSNVDNCDYSYYNEDND